MGSSPNFNLLRTRLDDFSARCCRSLGVEKWGGVGVEKTVYVCARVCVSVLKGEGGGGEGILIIKKKKQVVLIGACSMF